MTNDTDTIGTYVEDHQDQFLEDLFEILSQPSISASGEGVRECLEIIQQKCKAYGFDETHTVETDGQPSIITRAFANHNPDNTLPTILIYGHYDVQPVNPEEWTTPPFQPTIREGPDGRDRIYARGAGDNKGQWFTHLCAVQGYRETEGLPLNVTLILEGEEESGSPNIQQVVEENTDLLSADILYGADGPIEKPQRPEVVLGGRGILYIQIDAEGPNRDLHSGNYGGPVPNPAWELVNIFSSMKDESGRITIDGYYDNVDELTALDFETLDSLPFDETSELEDLGLPTFAGGPGETYMEKIMYYPTLNIAGFTSGFGGEGMKTIIPSEAQMKIDMRLVESQDPDRIYEKFTKHVHQHSSGAVDITISRLATMEPQRTPLDSPFVDPIRRAVTDAWGTEPVLKPSAGGSGPFYAFVEELGLPYVKVPYGNSDENNHSPNENFALDCFKSGIKTDINVFKNLRHALNSDTD